MDLLILVHVQYLPLQPRLLALALVQVFFPLSLVSPLLVSFLFSLLVSLLEQLVQRLLVLELYFELIFQLKIIII
jgi:hypothetical protein